MRLWSRLGRFVRKLRRRGVLQATAAYAVGAWIVVQVAAATFSALPLPGWAHPFVIVLALCGLPVVVAVAWAYEITPEGIQRTVEEEEPPELIRARGTPWGALLLVGVVTAASAGLGWAAWDAWLRPGTGGPTAAADTAPGAEEEALPRNRVAVLPFGGPGAADSTSTVADGLTMGLIRDLDEIAELDVVSYRGVRPYRDTDVSLPLDSVARALGAGSLVTGSVQAMGDSLEVVLQLVDGRDASAEWTGSVRAPRDAFLTLRDELRAGALRGLRQSLGEQIEREADRQVADSPEAWELYYRAESMLADARELRLEGEKEVAAGVYRRADSLLAEAAESDPDWADPVIERGWLELERAQLPGREFAAMDDSRLRIGLRHADRVLNSEPGDPAALELRGALLNALSQHPAHADTAAALRERAIASLRTAVSADLERARAWAELSDLYRQEGRFEEARDAVRRARTHDAFLFNEAQYLVKATNVAMDAGQLDRALELAQRGRRLFPDNAWWDQAILLALSSAGGPTVPPDSVWSILSRYEQLRGREDPYARLQVAAVLARHGLADSARAVLRRSRQLLRGQGGSVAKYYEANVRLHLGEIDRVLELLREYLEANPDRRAYVARDVYWKPVRGDSAFRELVRSHD